MAGGRDGNRKIGGDRRQKPCNDKAFGANREGRESVAGTNRFMRLRREDLDARFPGLLDAVLNSAAKDADRLQLLPECETVEVD
ncbi:hypothetical protein M2189_004305 [Bradyrhizobium japonicum]|nr:hypothetical protein [Bradyrhizobium japonicum]MCS3961102.1 hypothetical protein [Bradyrhizobium japonicum]MCS4002856.1 hypothetical protein [Bradyrhizobium japonicum]